MTSYALFKMEATAPQLTSGLEFGDITRQYRSKAICEPNLVKIRQFTISLSHSKHSDTIMPVCHQLIATVLPTTCQHATIWLPLCEFFAVPRHISELLATDLATESPAAGAHLQSFPWTYVTAASMDRTTYQPRPQPNYHNLPTTDVHHFYAAFGNSNSQSHLRPRPR